MGNKKKFDKIELNESYYETHREESEPVKEKKKEKKEKKNKEPKTLVDLNVSELPEKKKISSRFTFTKEKRTVVSEENDTEQLKSPSKAPYVYSLIVLCLVFVMKIVVVSDAFFSLAQETRAIIKTVLYLMAFVVPSVIFMMAIKEKRHLHNIRLFSVNVVPFAASSLGLLLCLTALQKYLIAYTFSYSEPTVAAEGSLAVSLLVGALLPAVCEELFVRGILQHEISEYAGGLCGVLVGAFVFAMLHFEFQYFFIYFVAGIVLGSITHTSRSVFPAMAVHFFNNAFSIMFSDKLSFVATERIGGTLLIIVLASFCFGFLILTLHLAEKISEKRAGKYLSDEGEAADGKNDEKNVFYVLSPDGKTARRFFKVLTNPAMLVSFAIFIVIAFTGI